MYSATNTQIFVAEHLVATSILDVAASYNNIAIIYKNQGKYEEVLEYYQKDLDITVRVVGGDHPDVAASFNNIGAVYAGKGDVENALVQYQKALEILSLIHI